MTNLKTESTIAAKLPNTITTEQCNECGGNNTIETQGGNSWCYRCSQEVKPIKVKWVRQDIILAAIKERKKLIAIVTAENGNIIPRTKVRGF